MAEWHAGSFAGASSDMRPDGDFYGAGEVVYRGVTLDCPNELEADVYRGVGLPSSPYEPGDYPFGWAGLDECCGRPAEGLSNEMAPDMYREPYAEEFLDAAVCQPGSDECFSKSCTEFEDMDFLFADSTDGPPRAVEHLPATSFCFLTESPAALLQRLYNFLRNEPGKILKCNPDKYACKADVLQQVGGLRLACRLKGRIYRAAPEAGSSALEASSAKPFLVCFYKQSGDALSFQKTVARALHHLRLIPDDALAWEEVHSPPESHANVGEPMLQPLLDMLEDDGSPDAGAKCAEALAAIATLVAANTISVASLCAVAGQLHCLNLLKALASSSRVELSYPARYLESALHEVLPDEPAKVATS
eukprot:TRINITY_DN107285_c0_g1_i1.p1 TRINITY_DN107285_c0_g1~~TRINITY_DN107285_c0_g1_i1.p1  ORF type:complete len:397 (-),score=91.87 TRINITY_DN107285_c0_g1_i1:227-1312(-)